MSIAVVENVINAFSKNKRFVTRDRLLALAGLASYLLSLASAKKPSLAPLHQAFTTLTAAEPDVAPTQDTTQTRIIQQIQLLRAKVGTATKSEKVKLRVQIDGLVDLLQG